MKQTVALVPATSRRVASSERVLATLLARSRRRPGRGSRSRSSARSSVRRRRRPMQRCARISRASSRRGSPRRSRRGSRPRATRSRAATIAAIKSALEALAGERGALAWALRGRWQCSHCGNRPGQFSWRCGQCRRWGTLKMETGVEPPPVQRRASAAEMRAHAARRPARRGARASLPSATLDPGLSDDELREAGTRRSLLNRVGGWFSNRRGAATVTALVYPRRHVARGSAWKAARVGSIERITRPLGTIADSGPVRGRRDTWFGDTRGSVLRFLGRWGFPLFVLADRVPRPRGAAAVRVRRPDRVHPRADRRAG